MANFITTQDASQIATEELNNGRHVSGNYSLHADSPPYVSAVCIEDLRDANKFSSDDQGRVSQKEVEELFAHTRVLNGVGLSVLRVSIKPLAPSGPCDRLPNLEERKYVGWDFANTKQLSEEERLAAIEGIWPLRQENLRRAMILKAWFLPSMKGFVDGSLIRRVTGYHLDLTTKKQWVQTRKPRDNEIELILGNQPNSQQPWQHAWVQIPRGSVAAFSHQI